jgi:Fungal specific transcription factor domain
VVAPDETPKTSPENNDMNSVISERVSSSIPNGDDPSVEENTTSNLDIEHLDHQFSTTLPELEHLDTPPPMTGLSLDLNSNVGQPQTSSSGISQQESAIPPTTNRAILSNRILSYGNSSASPFRSHLRSQASRLSILSLPRRSLEDPSSTLVEYYFKEVAGLFSSYDSHMNPFRTTVSRLWASSPAMCRTLQSMAAATLVDDFPQFGPLGLKMRKDAISILESEEVLDDKSLLAMLMLGQTASWHNPNDLGVSFFNTLRNHLNSSAIGVNGGSLLTNRNNYQFFEEALVYWEMLLSYVSDHSTLTSSTRLDSQTASDGFLTQKVPHPWTGIARDTQFIVHKVGRLVRRERKRMRTKRFTSQRDIAQAQEAIQEAQQLEERLLSLAHPEETDVVNPGDDDTPVWHLLAMAEVYRYTGLIQLYRVFPDLLRERLQEESMPRKDMTSNSVDPTLLYQPDDPITALLSNASLPHDVFSSIDSLQNTGGDDGGTDDISEDVQTEWLTTIALMAMSRLKTVPLESRTRCLQPFLLVASSSELRLPPMEAELPALDSSGGEYSLNLSAHAIEVSRTRKFMLGRLSSFLHVLPPKPIHICVELVQEVWRRMDAGESDVYWMDVMIDHGWETTMG